MKNSIAAETLNFLKDYSNGRLLFSFPALPSISEVELVYSLDDWSSIQHAKMILNENRSDFELLLKTDRNVAYRFKYLKKNTPEIEYWEDNRQRNFYFPLKRLSFQNVKDEKSAIKDLIINGKSILFQYINGDIEKSMILFPFSNVFYYKSLLDNFLEFFIYDGRDIAEPFIEKKINDRLTWYLPKKHDLVDETLLSVLQECLKNDRIEIGIIPLQTRFEGVMKGLETTFMLNLDYFIRGGYIIWPESEN